MGSVTTSKKAIVLGSAQRGSNANAMQLSIDLSVENPFAVNLSGEVDGSRCDNVQTLYIDNSANQYPLTIEYADYAGVKHTVPAGAQAYIPVAFPEKPSFTVSSSSTDTIQILALSVACPAAVWYPVGSDSVPEVATTTITIPSGQTTSTSFARAGQTLRGFRIPVALTGTEFEIEGSLDNSTFYSIYNSAGQKALMVGDGGAAIAAGIWQVDIGDGLPVNYLRVKSNAAEGATRTITPILE